MLRAALVEVPREECRFDLIGVGTRDEKGSVGHRAWQRVVHQEGRAVRPPPHDEYVAVPQEVVPPGS
jgi:hypothetical protein